MTEIERLCRAAWFFDANNPGPPLPDASYLEQYAPMVRALLTALLKDEIFTREQIEAILRD